MLRLVPLFVLILGLHQTATAGVARIADGDCSGLSAAVTAAASSATSTTILLARNGHYPSCSLQFPVAATTPSALYIDAQGAHLESTQLDVQAGSVTLKNATFESPNSTAIVGIPCDAYLLGRDSIYYNYASWLCNAGSLTLDAVTFHDMALPNEVSPNGSTVHTDNAVVIGNSGNLVLRNVTISNISGSVLPSSLIGSDGSGSFEIYNSTFANSQFGSSASAAAIIGAQHSDSGSNDRIFNSLFAANSFIACSHPVRSVGGNLAVDASCGFGAASGDVIAANAGLAVLGNNGGLVPTQALTNASPARGIGVAQYCEAVDARGYTRAATTCDAGAYEYGGGAGALTASGLNGVFYDAAADGHYVSIQRIHDNGDILVIWDTFDRNGNPAWIYGVGQLTDKHIHLAMSQNLGGVLQPGGPALGSKSRAWGTVDIDLTSCLLAEFSYQSNFSEFGRGAFPLTRLAVIADFGCSN